MLMRFLGSTYALIAIWIVAPVVLWWVWRRSRGTASGERKKPLTPVAPAVSSGAGKEKREPAVPGFRDLRWGDAPPDGMTVVHEEGERKLCTRDGEDLSLDGTPVGSILYSFHRGQLVAVRIEMPLGAGERVFRSRSAVWGAPKQASKDQQRTFWLDLFAGSNATQAVFEKNTATAKASLTISQRSQEPRDRTRAPTPS